MLRSPSGVWSSLALGRGILYSAGMDKDRYYEGLLFKQEGQLAEALDAFEEAAGDDAESAAAWNEMGLLYDDDGRMAKAAQCYEKATVLDPGFAKAWNNWGVTFFVRGDYAEARTRFAEALRLDPQMESARLNLADAEEERAGPV